jgi:hypothetical protein
MSHSGSGQRQNEDQTYWDLSFPMSFSVYRNGGWKLLW